MTLPPQEFFTPLFYAAACIPPSDPADDLQYLYLQETEPQLGQRNVCYSVSRLDRHDLALAHTRKAQA